MTTATKPDDTNPAEGQTQAGASADKDSVRAIGTGDHKAGSAATVASRTASPASIPYPAFKERLKKRDARIASLEEELAAANQAREQAATRLQKAQPAADQWRSYVAARQAMLKEQVPAYLHSAIDSQPLSEAERTVAAYLKESIQQPGTDSRRPSAGGAAPHLKPVSEMTSAEVRGTHQQRLAQYR